MIVAGSAERKKERRIFVICGFLIFNFQNVFFFCLIKFFCLLCRKKVVQFKTDKKVKLNRAAVAMSKWSFYAPITVVYIVLFLAGGALISAGGIILNHGIHGDAHEPLDKYKVNGAILLTFGLLAVIAEVVISWLFCFRGGRAHQCVRNTLVLLWCFRILLLGIMLLMFGIGTGLGTGGNMPPEKKKSLRTTGSAMQFFGIVFILSSLIPCMCIPWRDCRLKNSRVVNEDGQELETAPKRRENKA